MAYPTRFTVKGLPDGMCWARPCMRPGEDKGPYAQGRGYTAYYAVPRPCCMRNHLRGCPDPVPDPDPENARCCFRPRYERRGTALVNHRECTTCGAHASTRCAKLLNALPTLPGVACRHATGTPTLLVGWYQCESCRAVWDHRPREFEVGQYTFDELLAELSRRLGHVPP